MGAKKLIGAERKNRDLWTARVQGCHFFLGTAYQNGKNIPNINKIYQMAPKYGRTAIKNIPTYIFQSKTLQNLPKWGFLVWKYAIWQPCTFVAIQCFCPRRASSIRRWNHPLQPCYDHLMQPQKNYLIGTCDQFRAINYRFLLHCLH
jgi:hypothetical protein